MIMSAPRVPALEAQDTSPLRIVGIHSPRFEAVLHRDPYFDVWLNRPLNQWESPHVKDLKNVEDLDRKLRLRLSFDANGTDVQKAAVAAVEYLAVNADELFDWHEAEYARLSTIAKEANDLLK